MFSDAFDSMEAHETVLELEKRKLQEVRSVHLVLSKTISSFRTDLETFQSLLIERAESITATNGGSKAVHFQNSHSESHFAQISSSKVVVAGDTRQEMQDGSWQLELVAQTVVTEIESVCLVMTQIAQTWVKITQKDVNAECGVVLKLEPAEGQQVVFEEADQDPNVQKELVVSAENDCHRCGDVIANLHLQIRELQRDLKEQMQWKEDLASDDHQKNGGSCETSPQHQHDLIEDVASHSVNPVPYKVPCKKPQYGAFPGNPLHPTPWWPPHPPPVPSPWVQFSAGQHPPLPPPWWGQMHPSSWTWPRCAWSSGPALQASSQVVTPSVAPMIPSVAIQVSPPPVSLESAENDNTNTSTGPPVPAEKEWLSNGSLGTKEQTEWEAVRHKRKSQALKRRKVEVKSNGTIDESCEGKLQWDRDLRLAVPRFLDVSIISLQNQNPQEMSNLRVYMEAKYKYVNHSVSDSGFNDCVLHQLDSERARLKKLYFGPTKQIMCPKNAHPVAWRKLKAQWQDEEIRRKAQMKTGSEAQAVVPLHLLKAQLVSPPCLPPLVIPCHIEQFHIF